MKKQKNLKLEKETIDFFDKQFNGKGTAGMQICLEYISDFMADHPITTTISKLSESICYILLSAKYITIKAMAQLKGLFTEQELSVIISAMEGSVLPAAAPGVILKTNLFYLLEFGEWTALDQYTLIKKIKDLDIAEAATLELWAYGAWNHTGESQDNYIKKLL